MSFVRDFVHLTWRGRASMLYYPLRRLFVEPAPPETRCFMGAPVGAHVHCPRPADDGEFLCRWHLR